MHRWAHSCALPMAWRSEIALYCLFMSCISGSSLQSARRIAVLRTTTRCRPHNRQRTKHWSVGTRTIHVGTASGAGWRLGLTDRRLRLLLSMLMLLSSPASFFDIMYQDRDLYGSLL